MCWYSYFTLLHLAIGYSICAISQSVFLSVRLFPSFLVLIYFLCPSPSPLADSRKSSEVKLEDIKNMPTRMSRLLEDDDGEQAALKESGFVNILKDEKTVRSSITKEQSRENVNGNDVRRQRFRERRRHSEEKKQGELSDEQELLNGCITEESGKEAGDEFKGEGNELTTSATDFYNNNEKTNGSESGKGVRAGLEDFDQVIELKESDSSPSDDDDDNKEFNPNSSIPFNQSETMYPTLSKSKRTTSLPIAMEVASGRKGSTTSTDSARTESDDDRDVRRAESFASFGSSIKTVQRRQVRKVCED